MALWKKSGVPRWQIIGRWCTPPHELEIIRFSALRYCAEVQEIARCCRGVNHEFSYVLSAVYCRDTVACRAMWSSKQASAIAFRITVVRPLSRLGVSSLAAIRRRPERVGALVALSASCGLPPPAHTTARKRSASASPSPSLEVGGSTLAATLVL